MFCHHCVFISFTQYHPSLFPSLKLAPLSSLTASFLSFFPFSVFYILLFPFFSPSSTESLFPTARAGVAFPRGQRGPVGGGVTGLRRGVPGVPGRDRRPLPAASQLPLVAPDVPAVLRVPAGPRPPALLLHQGAQRVLQNRLHQVSPGEIWESGRVRESVSTETEGRKKETLERRKC